MIKRYIFGLFFGIFVVLCSAEEANLQNMLKSLEAEKIGVDKEVVNSRQNINVLTTKNSTLRKSFLDNKRNLQPDTFKFTDEESVKKLAGLKAALKKVDAERAKIMNEIKDLMDSDVTYKKLDDVSNKQLAEIKGLRELQTKANMRLTVALKSQHDVDGKILDITKQIELKKKSEKDGDEK